MAKGLYFDAAVHHRWIVRTRQDRLVTWARVVMEGRLNRALAWDEQVHHINGDRTDDRLENLELLSIQEHSALHWRERRAAWEYEWSEHYPACVDCGRTDRKHNAKGLCNACYNLNWHRKRGRPARNLRKDPA